MVTTVPSFFVLATAAFLDSTVFVGVGSSIVEVVSDVVLSVVVSECVGAVSVRERT